VENILSAYGIDSTCMKAQPFLVEKMVSECSSKAPTATVLATKDDSDVDVDGVKLTGYTIGIIVIFCLQIFFCIGICFYSQG
jgi:hypothetical protein